MLLIPFVAIIFLALATPSHCAKTTPEDKLMEDVQALLLEFYPKAKCTKKDDTLECRFNTRTFMIHHAYKTGEWQEAVPQEGPNRGGILCTISHARGPWMGAAMVPQTFEYRYFSTLLMAPYNKSIDTHLTANLSYPDNVQKQFLTRYNKLIASFADKDH